MAYLHFCIKSIFLFAAKESTDFDTFLNQKVKSSLLKGLISCVWRGWSHDSSLDIVSSEHIFVVSYNKAYVHHYCNCNQENSHKDYNEYAIAKSNTKLNSSL